MNNWIPLQTNFYQCALTSAAAAWEFGLWAAWGLFSQFVLCCPLDDPVGIIIITIISCDLWERTLQSDRAYTTFFSFSIDDIWENRKLPLYSQVAESLKIKGGQLLNQSIITRQGSQKLFLMPQQKWFLISTIGRWMACPNKVGFWHVLPRYCWKVLVIASFFISVFY